MDQFWQQLLNLKQPELPPGYHTVHFTNEDLRALLGSVAGGNTFAESTTVGRVAEELYDLPDETAYLQSEQVHSMVQNGMGRFVHHLWSMIAAKRSLPKPSWEMHAGSVRISKLSPEMSEFLDSKLKQKK